MEVALRPTALAPRARATPRQVAIIVLLAAAYIVAGKLGLTLASVHASATAVWPPTGIAIAAFLLLGYGVWPGILVGAFVVNVTTAGDVVSSLGIASGNTLEGLVAARLVARFARGRHAFERPQDVFKFALLAALVATVVSATFGVTSLALTGFARWADYGPIWLTWWLGDAGGALIVAPLIVLWVTQPRVHVNAARAAELVLLGVALALTGLFVFGGLQSLSVDHYPLEFLTLPALVWAAFRFGPRESATATILLAAIAVWGTINGFGPFTRRTENDSLLLLQSFMGTAQVMSLALAAAVLDRRRTDERLRLTEQRLRAAEERKVAARDEFLSVAAHELRTPMTSLQVAIQFLSRQLERDGALDPAQARRALGGVNDQAAKLGRLVTQLLDTVRVQSGRMELELKDEDLVDLAARAVEQAQATTTRHQLALAAPHRVVAAVDRLRLEQVIANLLDNAIKFSPAGGRIEVELGEAGSDLVRLSVRDHGVGIAPDHRPHVFDRFYQARGGSRAGLGLGLHVSRHIVELHGGEIHAEFPADGGTKLVVELPTGIAAARDESEREVHA